MTDNVNHPKHYTAYKGLEIIDLTEQMNFNKGNAVKYIARAGLKDPATEIEDLQKAVWYINREIQRIQKNRVKESEGDKNHESIVKSCVKDHEEAWFWIQQNHDLIANCSLDLKDSNITKGELRIDENKIPGAIEYTWGCDKCEFIINQAKPIRRRIGE